LITTTIVNVVATAALNHEVDLDELGKFGEITHDPDIYGGRVAYFKSSAMKGSVSIFASGKMISVGTTSGDQAVHELEYAKEFLLRNGFVKPVTLQCKVQNIVVVASFGDIINLEELAKNYKVIYEPELFPGGILKIERPYKATALIYASGKAIVTGLKAESQISIVIQEIESIIESITK